MMKVFLVSYIIASFVYMINASEMFSPDYQPRFHPVRHFNYYPRYTNPYFGNFQNQKSGYFDRLFYDNANKALKDESFEAKDGDVFDRRHQGQEGFTEGQKNVKDVRGDAGSYSDEEGGLKRVGNGRLYHSQQHFAQTGNNGKGENKNANHKKGHTKKGFKTSHHKDETGETETFYDEAHDEGDTFNYKGNEGSFGNKGQSSEKGNHEHEQFEKGVQKKQGHYDRGHAVADSNGHKGQYGQKGHAGSGEAYRFQKGLGEHSLLGRQEANRIYLNHHPHGYIPFYEE